MNVSSNFAVSQNTMVNSRGQKKEKKISPIARGALYGAIIGCFIKEK